MDVFWFCIKNHQFSTGKPRFSVANQSKSTSNLTAGVQEESVDFLSGVEEVEVALQRGFYPDAGLLPRLALGRVDVEDRVAGPVATRDISGTHPWTSRCGAEQGGGGG